jgi:hypothetical protein
VLILFFNIAFICINDVFDKFLADEREQTIIKSFLLVYEIRELVSCESRTGG